MKLRDLDGKSTRSRITHVLDEIVTAVQPRVVDDAKPLVGVP